jgi:hypothetical protein
MTAKEKAKELVNKYNLSFAGVISNEEDWEFLAKQCALIAVDMVIECCRQYDELNETFVTQINHWQEVKQELDKL